MRIITIFILMLNFAIAEITEYEQNFNRLIEATRSKDRDSFLEGCNDKMKEAMTIAVFEKYVEQVSPLLSAPRVDTFLTKVKRGNLITYYWVLDIHSDNENDLIVEMTMKDGLISGFKMW